MSNHPDVIHVLSIEDNPVEATLIQEKVAEAQRVGWRLPRFEIEHVTHLNAALARLEEGGIDVVLSDLDLPDSRAGETVATLREHIPHRPLVVLTGREDAVLAHESVQADVQDYLYKEEATGSLLARTLMYAIERQQAQANLEQRVEERTAELRQANEKLQRANQALRESEARERARAKELETIMDAVPAVIWVAEDPTGQRITGNAASYRMLRMPDGTNTSMTAGEGQPPSHFTLVHAGEEVSEDQLPMQRACTYGEMTMNYESEIVFDDGTQRTLFGNTVPLRDDTGQVRGAVAAYVDITERKQAEKALRESEERFWMALENLPAGVFAHDLDGHLLLVNRTACENTGYTRSELLTMSVKDIDHSSVTRDDRDRLWHQLEAGESTKFESIHVRKDGSVYPVEIYLSAVTLEGQPALLALAFDITERKRAEEALRKRECGASP